MYAFPSDIGDICQSTVQNGKASHVGIRASCFIPTITWRSRSLLYFHPVCTRCAGDLPLPRSRVRAFALSLFSQSPDLVAQLRLIPKICFRGTVGAYRRLIYFDSLRNERRLLGRVRKSHFSEFLSVRSNSEAIVACCVPHTIITVKATFGSLYFSHASLET